MKRRVTLDGRVIDRHDSDVIELWSGWPIPREGDIVLVMTDEHALSLSALLLMLNKKV